MRERKIFSKINVLGPKPSNYGSEIPKTGVIAIEYF